LLGIFALPDVGSLVLLLMNVSLLFTWHAPLLGILVLVATARPSHMDELQTDLALGVVVTLGFFALYPKTQGHGWGYRYSYQVLGNLCLLAAAGVPTMVAALGAHNARRWITVGIAIAVAVQLPLRLRRVEAFVRPFAATTQFVRDQDAAAVILWSDSIWYGRDLIRNDPFLRSPVVVRGDETISSRLDSLRQRFPGRVVEISTDQLIALGMTPLERKDTVDTHGRNLSRSR
jgi:hypothetical protein